MCPGDRKFCLIGPKYLGNSVRPDPLPQENLFYVPAPWPWVAKHLLQDFPSVYALHAVQLNIHVHLAKSA